MISLCAPSVARQTSLQYSIPCHAHQGIFGVTATTHVVDCVWNVTARAETRFCLSAKWTSPFKSAGGQFSRLLAAEMCASAVVMLDTPCSEVVWRVLATHSFRQFPLHFLSRASPCAITFQLDSTSVLQMIKILDFICVNEFIQGAPGGICQTSGECSLC